jgi:hypothetical protein
VRSARAAGREDFAADLLGHIAGRQRQRDLLSEDTRQHLAVAEEARHVLLLAGMKAERVLRRHLFGAVEQIDRRA